MYPVSARFLAAIRNPPPIVTRVEVWRSNVRVDNYGDNGLPVYAGQVEIDATKLTRRTLTGLQVDATDANWALLSPIGTELRPWRGFRFGVGQTEVVPLGRFRVGDLSETYGGDWGGQIGSAFDPMDQVAKAGFITPRTFPAGTLIRTLIRTLMFEVLGPVTVTATSMAALTSDAVYERDRLDAIDKAAQSIGAAVYVAADGTPMLVDQPTLGTPVWTVDTGDTGIMYRAGRTRTLDRTYSAVVATPAQIDGTAPFPPQVAYDDNPDSPTYWRGPFGLVPYRMSSELFSNAGQAIFAARTRLPLVTAPHAQVDIEAECNAALEGFDTIAVAFPKRLGGATGTTERQMIRTATVPLTAAGTQSMTTMSSAVDIPDSE